MEKKINPHTKQSVDIQNNNSYSNHGVGVKVCLYLEFYHFLGGILFKNIGTGLLSSYKNQRIILKTLGVEFTEKWDDSCDILQINTPWLKSVYLMKKAKKKGKKIIVWSHVSAEDIQGVFRFSSIISPIAKKYLAYAYNLADVIFAPSEHTKNLLKAYGISTDKVVVMSNGVDVKKFIHNEKKREEMREKYGLSGVVVGNVGLVIPRKGTDVYLSMAKKFPKNKFVWFGKIYSSMMAESLPKKIPENLNFTGYVDDIVAAFDALDIFMFPEKEGNEGMVVLEAAALGLPMLLRDIPTYKGWMVDEKNCLMAKTDAEFEMRLKELIENPELRKKLGENAKIMANERSMEALGTKTLGVYKKLLA